MMYNYSVMPLNENHIEEICEDIIRQKEDGVTFCPLMMIKLHPEGNPIFNKAEKYGKLFKKYKDILMQHGINPGILVQSTLGHEYVIDEPANTQRVVRPDNGELLNAYCPADPKNQEYFRNAFRTLAEYHPSAMMIDDDFKVAIRRPRGCMCENHLKAFNDKAETNYGREELYSYLESHDKNDKLVKIYEETQTDALCECAKAMREGIDSVDPTIQGIVCTNFAYKEVDRVAPIFAGKGNPVIMRGPDGSYAPPGVLYFSDMARRAAITKYTFKDVADILISETDAIPYNRYGKSANYLHTQYSSAILEGMKGGKFWITRFYEHSPISGEAYRKILSKYRKFYEKLASLSDEISWLGCKIPLCRPENDPRLAPRGFSECVFERLGIPFYFSPEPGGVVCINGDVSNWFNKEEIEEFFKDNVLISSDAAAEVIELGLGKYLGVDVKPWNGANISGEYFDNGNGIDKQVNSMELIPNNEKTETLSRTFHWFRGERQFLFPAVTSFEHNGKTTVTFCGTPKAQHNYLEAFSFLCEQRKNQLVEILSKMDCLPVYYFGDAQVTLRAGTLNDGRMLVYIYNMGYDTLESISLSFAKPVKNINILTTEGEEKPLDFTESDSKIKLNIELEMLKPIVLITE